MANSKIKQNIPLFMPKEEVTDIVNVLIFFPYCVLHI